MISGVVSPRLEPKLSLELIDDNGIVYTVEVLLDTGFEGNLVLPSRVIRDVGLRYFDDYEATLADGSIVEWAGYECQLTWHGRRRNIIVLESEGEALLGMNLLWRNWITIDNYANGPVVIEELG